MKLHIFAPEPCGSCPYRRDVAIGTWHPTEFENLLAQDRDPLTGRIFGCHRFRRRPQDAEICAGWFLDQKRRGYPSIALRIALMNLTSEPVVTDGGHLTYDSVEQMCAANSVHRARRKRRVRSR